MNNKYIGCVTVDIELTSITNLISDIRIGDTESAILITGTGTYMAGVSEDKIQNEINITEDDNASLANVKLLATETEESMQMVKEIRERANEVGESSNKSFETATALTEQFKTKLQVSIENAKVVESIGELLSFVQDTVSPDCQKFVEVARQYGEDATSIDESSDRISNMSYAIENIMQEVTDAIQNIAEAAQNTTELSSNIMEAITQLSGNVTDISDMSDRQDIIVRDLNDVVSKFTLD